MHNIHTHIWDAALHFTPETIRETDPKTPSTRLTKLGEEAQKLADDLSRKG